MPTPVEKPKSLSVFAAGTKPPTGAELNRALGSAAAAWAELLRRVRRTHAPTVELWNFGGAKFGWSLRVKRSEKVILYLIPQAGRFLVGIVLGAKAVAAARGAGLPDAVLEAIAAAPRYAEGTGLRLPVEDESQLAAIEKLAELKMAPR